MGKQEDTNAAEAQGNVSDAVDRAAAAYGRIDARLAGAGGVGAVVALYEQVRQEMDRIEYAEFDRVAAEIKDAIETLLQMDADVRKLNNLKLLLDREHGAGAGADEKEKGGSDA